MKRPNVMKINRTIPTIAVALLAVTGSMAAQTRKLVARTGDTFRYDVNVSFDQTVDMAGTETVNRGSVTSGSSLMARSVDKDQASWTYDPGHIRLKLENQMLPGGKIDTSIAPAPMDFSTDLKGKLVGRSVDDQSILSTMLGGAAYAGLFNDWFSPTLRREVKPGQSWDENRSDSVTNGMVGIRVHSTSTVHYTYDGLVDTLGSRCMHVRARVTSMAMEGSGAFGGMNVSIDGDGTSSSDLYYSADDGILKSVTLDMESNLRMMINGEGDMVVPIAQHVAGTVVRK